MNPIARRVMPLASLLLLVSCAGTKNAAHTAAVEGHVYALPLDDVLNAATTLLTRKGWHVERSGDTLGTNWHLDASGAALGYRVEGERIDAEHCSVRIESLSASSFAPPPEGTGGRATSGGSRSTEWEGVDAPTTLGEPPPGMVTLPRGRDEALEWALLQALDPRDANAIQHADARAVPRAPTDAGVAARVTTPSPEGCEPELTGVAGLFSERSVVLVADVPGTNEIPELVGRLACQAARAGVPTVVALELLHGEQDWVDTYLASQGRPADRAAFLQVMRSFDPRASGNRGSAAVLRLLDQLRLLRDAGLALRVVAFAEPPTAPSGAKTRASTLEAARRAEPEALLLVLLDRSQARTVLAPNEAEERAPVGWYLMHWGLHPVALDVHGPGGETWACASSRCGPGPATLPVASPAAAAPSPSVELYASPDAQGFSGAYNIGPLSASSQATP